MNNITPFRRRDTGPGQNGAGLLSERLAAAAAHHDAGRLQEAESLYRDILTQNPTCAPARHRLGVLAFQSGQAVAALKLIDSAVLLEPENPVFHMSLGAMLRSQNRLDEAEVACRKSIELDPNSPDAHNNLGNVLKEVEDQEGALTAYETVLFLQPDHVMASLNLAALYREKGDTGLAFDVLGGIEAQVGGTAEFRNEMGLTHLRAFRPDEAALLFKAALMVDPKNASYLNNLGLALRSQGKLKEALAAYNLAIDLQPGYGEVRWNRSAVHLMLGDWQAGLADWHYRRVHSEFRERAFPQPLWTGRKLRRGRLLVHAEQGVGDEVLYASMLSLVLRQTPDVLLEVDARLVPLMARSFPMVEVVAKSEPLHPACLAEDIGGRLPLPDLVGLVGATGPAMRCSGGYLTADPERVLDYQAWLREIGPGPYTGISWRSGAGRTGERKSVPLTEWAPLFTGEERTYVNLQYGETEKSIAEAEDQFGIKIHTVPDLDRFDDLDGLAALIQALDVTVTSSNVTANLAGALGGDVRALFAPPELWYWGHEGRSVPFFPNLMAYRKDQTDGWENVMRQVAADLSGGPF